MRKASKPKRGCPVGRKQGLGVQGIAKGLAFGMGGSPKIKGFDPTRR